MPQTEIETTEYRCVRCHYRFVPLRNGIHKDQQQIRFCPKCKNCNWNRERHKTDWSKDNAGWKYKVTWTDWKLFSKKITTVEHQCYRCGYKWITRKNGKDSRKKPKSCAGCKSSLWDTPRVYGNTPNFTKGKTPNNIPAAVKLPTAAIVN